MNKRFASLFPNLAPHVKFLTIHRFAYQVIRLYEQLHSIRYEFVDQAHNPATHAKVILSKLFIEHLDTYPTDDELETMKSQIGLLKNLMLAPSHKKEIHELIENDADQLILIYTQYEAYKERHFLLDYDDILQTAHDILKHDSDIRNRVRQQYPYVQVDEAQDTSKLQYELIKLILTEQRNLFLVGDDDQSIYAFRGAYPKQLLDFKETFKEGQVIYMSENFRSSSNIVSSSAAFIARNKERYKKEISTPNDALQDINFHCFSSESKQLDYLINVCAQSPNLNEVAILYRQNVSALSLIETFERHNIPFRLGEGRLSFFSHPILKDIEAIITLASDPTHESAFRRVARLLYLNATLIQNVLSQPTDSLLKSTLIHSRHLKAYQQTKIKNFSTNLPNILSLSPKRALHYILETLEYRQYLIKKGNLKEEDDQNFTQGLGVLETLKLIADSQPTLPAFLSRLSHLKNVSSQSVTSQAVTLMTFHGCKGLEFDSVFLVDCMNNITPPATILSERRQKGDVKSGYEEERRLFYVAMTRARYRLELLSVEFKYGLNFQPSDFFVQVQQQLNPSTMPTKKREHRPLKEMSTRLLSVIDLSEFAVGTSVSHQIFGVGTILERDGEIASIQFEDNMKRISLRITLENGNLSLNSL